MIHTTQGVALCYVVLPLQGVFTPQGLLTPNYSLIYRHDCTPKVVAMAVSTVMTICRICFQIGDLFSIDIKVIRLLGGEVISFKVVSLSSGRRSPPVYRGRGPPRR